MFLLIDSNESSSQQLCWCLKKWQGGWGCWDCSGCDRWPFSYWGNGGNAWIVCIKCFGSWPTLHFQEDLRSPQSLSYSEDEREVMQSWIWKWILCADCIVYAMQCWSNVYHLLFPEKDSEADEGIHIPCKRRGAGGKNEEVAASLPVGIPLTARWAGSTSSLWGYSSMIVSCL